MQLFWKLTTRYVGRTMESHIRLRCEESTHCQKGKIICHKFVSSQTITPKGNKFAQVHLDLAGQLPFNARYVYLLNMIDRHSLALNLFHQRRTIKTKDQTISFHLDLRYGGPISITSDCVPKFEPTLYTSLMETIGSVGIRTTAYHPQSN